MQPTGNRRRAAIRARIRPTVPMAGIEGVRAATLTKGFRSTTARRQSIVGSVGNRRVSESRWPAALGLGTAAVVAIAGLLRETTAAWVVGALALALIAAQWLMRPRVADAPPDRPPAAGTVPRP